MEQDYENKRNRFEIKKGHEIQVVVKATSSDLHQNGGGILLAKTSNSFTSMHAVIKAIYEALPDYKGSISR